MSKPSTKADRAKEEAEVFRQAVKDAIPLPDKGRVLHPTPRPAPIPAQRMADDRKVLEDSLSDAPALERSGLNAARISAANSSGCSHAAKWPPFSVWWK